MKLLCNDVIQGKYVCTIRPRVAENISSNNEIATILFNLKMTILLRVSSRYSLARRRHNQVAGQRFESRNFGNSGWPESCERSSQLIEKS